ncbi:MAG: ComF family protein [Pseudomonadota bacterium]
MSILPRKFFDNRSMADRLLPAQPCLLCGTDGDGSATGPLCRECCSDLPPLPAARCPVCALPTPHGQTCGRCLKRPPQFSACVAAFAYAYPVDRLMLALKYGARLSVAPVFSQALMLAAAQAVPPDLIVPMPLSATRLRERGYNQALEIAKPLGRRLGITVATDACLRVRDTAPQADLPLKARLRNVRGAFAATASVAGKHVALVDDVMTSGATANEAAKALRKQGALSVSVWVAARTLPG